jgi:ribosomal protein S18 acetylase RimI-like enzyme
LGRQLSALLLQEALRIAAGGQVKLRVRRDNVPALSIYSALGFRVLDDESNAEVLAMAFG